MSILLNPPVCNQCGQQFNPEDLTCPTHGNTVYLMSKRQETEIVRLPLYYGDHQALLAIMFLFEHLAQQVEVDLIHGFRGPMINILKLTKEELQIAILDTLDNDLIINLPREHGVVVSMTMGTNFTPIYKVTVVDQNGKTEWVNVGVHKLYQNVALRAALKSEISI